MADEESLTVQVQVSTRAAILAGKTATGKRSLQLRPADLESLPVELRLEIAVAIENASPIGLDPDDPPIAEPTLDAIRPVLQNRADRRKRIEETERTLAARRAEEALVESRAVAAKDAQRTKALRAWVEKNGDDEQKKRMKEGFLPEQEILDEVAEELLDVRGFDVYVAMLKGEVCDCPCAGYVQFTERTPPTHLDMFEFKKLEDVREQLPEGAAAIPVEHQGKCPHCKCMPSTRITARVSIPWEGWLLRREFLLK